MTSDQNRIRVFISHASKDKALLDQLENHLSMLKREAISTWNTQQIMAGTRHDQTINEQLEQSSLILLLVSSSFLASPYLYERALVRQRDNLAQVVPILIRSCSWQDAPFANLKCLPENNKPVVEWGDRDRAWKSVVESLSLLIQEMRQMKLSSNASTPTPQPEQLCEISALLSTPPPIVLSNDTLLQSPSSHGPLQQHSYVPQQWKTLGMASIVLIIVTVAILIGSSALKSIPQSIPSPQKTNINISSATTTSTPTSSASIENNAGAKFFSPPWEMWRLSATSPWSLSNDKKQMVNNGMIDSCDPYNNGCDANKANKVMLFAHFSPEAEGMKNYAVQAVIEKVSCSNSSNSTSAFMVFAGAASSGYGYITGVAIEEALSYSFYSSFIGIPVSAQPKEEYKAISNAKTYTITLEIRSSSKGADITSTINKNFYTHNGVNDEKGELVGIASYGCQIHVLSFSISSL